MGYSSAEGVLEALVDAYYEKRDIDATLSCVTDDIEWVGTEIDDCASGKEALRALLKADVESFPDSFGIEMDEPKAQIIGEHGVIFTVQGSQKPVPGMLGILSVRGTVCAVKKENSWLISNVHSSVPNTEIETYHLKQELDDKRRQEETLTQKMLQNLVEEVPTGLGIYEIIDGKVHQQYMNDAFYKMLGEDRERRIKYFGENTLHAAHPDDVVLIQDAVQRLISGEKNVNVEYRLKLENGNWFWVNLSTSVVEQRENYLKVYAVLSDFNEIKRAQQEKEQQYKEQLEISQIAMQGAISKVSLNLTENKVTTFESSNPLFEKQVCFHTADELLASVVKELTPEESKKFEEITTVDKLLEKYKNGEKHIEIICHVKEINQWVRVTYDLIENPYNKNIEAISAIYDVTEIMRAERVVSQLLSVDYQSILLIDVATGDSIPYKTKEENPSFDKILESQKTAQDNAQGLEDFFRAFCIEGTAEEVIEANRMGHIQEVLETEPYYENVYSIYWEGAVEHFRILYCYLDEGKDVLLSAAQNVTEMYNREIAQKEELTKALKVAEQANAAKTDFLSRISHDMRTPLNGILGLTTLLKEKITSPDEINDLQQLQMSGKYLLNLINDTLDVSKIESGKLELNPVVCEGRSVFNNVVALVSPNLKEKHIHFHVNAENLPFTILYIDVPRVEQIVMNVLGNAIKFTPDGGTIDFKMENISIEDELIVDRITITDNGIGMSEEYLPHLFEPFTQEAHGRTSSFQGTGLGMTITKQILEIMGGEIEVHSEVGKGTTFSFTLPMPIATKEQIEEWKKEKNSAGSEGMLCDKRVLLCEDHPLNAKIATRLLEGKGMIVEHAENGQIGVNMFRNSSERYYDLILMDIRMPEMDGLEAARTIRALPRMDALQIPIIAMTANAFDEDVRQVKEAGMDAHLGKPIDTDKLFETLSDMLQLNRSYKQQKILVVDDIALNRVVMLESLKDEYLVLEADNGKEAMKILEQNHGIDAVITDIQMPEMDGVELIKKIRENPAFRHIVIIANTQFGDPEQEEELLSIGANDFVYKPTTPKIVEIRVRNALRRI